MLAVYTAGYLRTRAAADRFELQAAVRRPANPSAPVVTPPAIALRPAPANLDVPPAPVTKSHARKVRTRGVEPQSDRTRPQRAAVGKAAPVQPPVVTAGAPATVPGTSLPAPVAEPPIAVVEQTVAAPAPAPPAPPQPHYKDGTYLGWGTSRHGDIQAAVIIQDGRILSATIAQCLTRYSCSVIAKLPPQVAQRQSPETDYVSGATQSTNAFYYAVVEALSKAK